METMNLSKLTEQHRATLDRLYARLKVTFDDEYDRTFAELDSYLATHNLSLATVCLITSYGKPEIEIGDLFL